MSRPDSIPAIALRGASSAISSPIVSRRASLRSSPRMSAVSAIVFCSTRAATGWRSAW